MSESVSAASPSLSELRSRLPGLALRDEHRLGRRLEGTRRIKARTKRDKVLAEISTAVDQAEERVERRRVSVPAVRFPDQLPVSQRRDDLATAIRDHQVVVVAGETGSGKTTQLPKICLELGRGIRGQIGHTQPRRIAARSVAERVAEEVETELGSTIGYTVRFTDRASDDSLVRIMTDGILLAQIADDPDLLRYDTIIIDEAHERSLTIDFLLGYLKRLLPRRPDLKVIITSATIDPQRFSRHFDDAPVLEVSGRMYPVEIRYRPLVDPDAAGSGSGEAGTDSDRDQVSAVLDAVDELCAEGPGDILVFFSGEREIRDAADALRPHLADRAEDVEVLPLYARLSAAEQHRVFQPHRGRRVVLATNVAETSLTVPGIRYVIDPGTARISRYSLRTKVQRLPIEPISQASAKQRAGRCGRVEAGVCIRLYSEDDFEARSEFTDPEILRTNLASVILQMTALGLGDMAAFPFVEPPDRRQVSDGLALLHELGAIDPTASDPRKRLTEIGRKISQLPVDPRLARMVLEADRTGCATEVIVLAAALSVQDPRERPTEKQEQAQAQHARFADNRSDFAAYLNLWTYLKQQQRELSGNQFRKRCRAEFLNYLRIREWQDLEAQLRHTAKDVGVTLNSTPANDASAATRIHTAVLSGLLSHIGLRDERRRDYQGARGARFSIFPGSGLFRKQPTWVVAAELVETSKLWGRICARIEPEWVEPLATHLVKRSYSEPTWSKKRASVVATERVTLYGVPIVAGRRVPYGRIDPEVSREMFIRHALVEGDWDTQHQFFHDNQALLEQAEQLEHRARRRDIVVDDDTLYDFYAARVGTEVVSGAHFDTWWKKTRRKHPDLLTFTPDMLVRDDLDDATAAADAAQYPDVWSVHTDTGPLELDLTYQFEPGSAADGVTAHVPIGVLNQLPRETFDWQVPGLRSELVTAMLRSLPKPVRKQLVPAPDVAAAVLDRVGPDDGALLPVLEDTLYALRQVDVPPDSWDLDKVPDHLLVTVRVEDEQGAHVAEGTDLPALQRELAGQTIATISSAVAAEGSDATTSSTATERAGMTSWSIGTLPQTSSARVNGHTVAAYPALADDGDSVSVRLTETVAVQQRTMWAGLRRLLLLTIPSPVNAVERDLPGPVKLALARPPHGDSASLLQDCLTCAVDALMSSGGAPVWDETGFTALREHVRGELGAVLADVVTEVTRILERAHTVEAEVSATTSLVLVPALTDMRTQLGELVYPGFVTATGRDRLGDIVRYLDAMSRRLEKLPHNAARAARDQDLMRTIHRVRAEYDDAVARLAPERQHDDDVRAVRWMLEELRVSFFAQSLGTRETVSEKRVLRAIDDL